MAWNLNQQPEKNIMQLKYRNNFYTVTTNPTVVSSEVLQGTYRGLSMAINVTQPVSTVQEREPRQQPQQLIQYRGIKTHLRFA